MIRHVNFSVVIIILSGIWISVISFVPVFITKAGNMVNSLLVGILIMIMSLIQRKQV